MELTHKQNLVTSTCSYDKAIDNGSAEDQEMKHESLLKILAKVNSAADKKSGNKENSVSVEQAVELCSYYESIIACMPNNVYWLDRECVFLGGNDNLAKILGLKSRKELVGMTYPEVSSLTSWMAGAAESFKKAELEVMETGVPRFNVEEPPLIINGEIRHYVSSKVPIYDTEDEIVGVVGISTDVTELKKTQFELKDAKEVAESTTKSKLQMIENMEHDIRTPLAGVIGLLNILADKEADQEMKGIIKEGSESVEALLEYCDTILNYARQNVTRVPVLAKRFSLIDLIDKVGRIEVVTAKSKGLRLKVDKDPDLPNTVIGDAFRIKSILINLLSNAIKFTDEGEISLRVTQEKQAGSRNAIIRFIVSDTGVGISSEKQQVIFESFAKVEPSNRSFGNSPGLGLRVVKDFVEELSGDIDLISSVGRGSTFTVDIPLKLPLIKD